MIKIGSFIKIINFEKTYKFIDGKGHTILPSSYKSIAKHFDNLRVISIDENGNIVANVLANKLYFITGISKSDIEPISTYWTIDLNSGNVVQIENPTKTMYVLGLVFRNEEAATSFYNAKLEHFNNK